MVNQIAPALELLGCPLADTQTAAQSMVDQVKGEFEACQAKNPTNPETACGDSLAALATAQQFRVEMESVQDWAGKCK